MKKIVMALTLVMALVGTVLLGCPVAQAAGGLKAVRRAFVTGL